MLILQEITYAPPGGERLFEQLHLHLRKSEKVALIGRNGTGKTSLLQLIAGQIPPLSGQILRSEEGYVVPQLTGDYDAFSVAEVLGISDQLEASEAILSGEATEAHFLLLNNDWTLEERCVEALNRWGLENVNLGRLMGTLSGGQKTKVFLAGISLHQPGLILLDEPTNHLDAPSREQFYQWLQQTKATLVVASHDRTLLSLLSPIYELSRQGLRCFEGNFQRYSEQKVTEEKLLRQQIHEQDRALRQAREKERESRQRQQKLDAKGKKKQEKAGTSRILMNTLKNRAEQSTSRLQGMHRMKVDSIAGELKSLRDSLPEREYMKLRLCDSNLPIGKVLFHSEGLNHYYGAQVLWSENLSFEIRSGERIAIRGANGTGKSTFLRILQEGNATLFSAAMKTVFMDQDYTLLQKELSVYEQAQQFNQGSLQEHEVKIRLHRYLFPKESWDKKCKCLSGGERMRLWWCCLTLDPMAPDLILLDEPTNNLDLESLEILRDALLLYEGTLIVISHDETFLKELRIEQEIHLPLVYGKKGN